MSFNITSGNVENSVLYLVAGDQSVIYQGVTFSTGQNFRGSTGASASGFSLTGAGSALVYEVSELKGGAVEFETNFVDSPYFTDVTVLNGFAVEFELNNNEKLVEETTAIKGFGIELLNFPFYSFEVIEHRLF